MTPAGTKDKIFAALFVPLAVAAAYIWFWRIPAAARLEKLEKDSAMLVETEDFEFRKAAAERTLETAKAELDSERAAGHAEGEVCRADGQAFAVREHEVLKVFSSLGISVLRSEPVPGGDAGTALSRASGIEDPVCRRYTLDGTYPSIRRALDVFSERRMPVVPERVDMRPTVPLKWTIDLWE